MPLSEITSAVAAFPDEASGQHGEPPLLEAVKAQGLLDSQRLSLRHLSNFETRDVAGKQIVQHCSEAAVAHLVFDGRKIGEIAATGIGDVQGAIAPLVTGCGNYPVIIRGEN